MLSAGLFPKFFYTDSADRNTAGFEYDFMGFEKEIGPYLGLADFSGDIVVEGKVDNAYASSRSSYHTAQKGPERPISHFALGSQIILGSLGFLACGYGGLRTLRETKGLDATPKFIFCAVGCASGLKLRGIGVKLALG